MIKLKIPIKLHMAPLNSPHGQTRFSLQTQLYTLTMPVQPSFNTEAAQPYFPAHAEGKPSSCSLCTLCAPDNSQSLSSCVPGAWRLYPSLTLGDLRFNNYYTYSLVGITQHWDGPTTSRKPLWFGDRKSLWSLNFEIPRVGSRVTGGIPLWQPYHIGTCRKTATRIPVSLVALYKSCPAGQKSQV